MSSPRSTRTSSKTPPARHATSFFFVHGPTRPTPSMDVGGPRPTCYEPSHHSHIARINIITSRLAPPNTVGRIFLSPVSPSRPGLFFFFFTIFFFSPSPTVLFHLGFTVVLFDFPSRLRWEGWIDPLGDGSMMVDLPRPRNRSYRSPFNFHSHRLVRSTSAKPFKISFPIDLSFSSVRGVFMFYLSSPPPHGSMFRKRVLFHGSTFEISSLTSASIWILLFAIGNWLIGREGVR